MNKVKILGQVATTPDYNHEAYDEKFYFFVMETKRKSGTVDFIPVMISEQMLKLINIGEGDWIELDGEYRSYNTEDRHLALYVFATEVKSSPGGVYGNDVQLEGFVCKSPTFRSTPQGREISDLLIAVPRNYNKSDYIPCIAWGRQAKMVSNLIVGSKIEIAGRIQSRCYKKNDETMIAYEISIASVLT